MRFSARAFAKTSSSLPRKAPQIDLPSRVPYTHLHRFDGATKAWQPLPLKTLPQPQEAASTKFQILSWNIEFSSPLIPERTTAILDYLQNHPQISSAQNDGIPTIILLQEVKQTAFPSILSHTFLQAHYDLTDISVDHFHAHYGTLTLVPQTLTPFTTGILRIPFQNSQMGRDALLVDLELPRLPQTPSSPSSSPKTNSRHIRIGNTHLESLRGYADIVRLQQLDLISQLISSADGGLVAGDMNAIAPTDDKAPHKAGLIDCWEVLHPDDEGHTWGYQPPVKRYPRGRVDKVLVSGNLSPVSIERVGMGKKLALPPLGSVWLSDHYGLLAQIAIY